MIHCVKHIFIVSKWALVHCLSNSQEWVWRMNALQGRHGVSCGVIGMMLFVLVRSMDGGMRF